MLGEKTNSPTAAKMRVRNFCMSFQGGPPGRSRRRHDALAFAPPSSPATAAPTPVGWREAEGSFGPLSSKRHQSRGGFDKGTLAVALIGLMWAGQKPARSPNQRTGRRPLSNPPLCPYATAAPSLGPDASWQHLHLNNIVRGENRKWQLP